ncbi:MAG: hypothetical protein HY525_09045 [Betaproteobacteria bacterium]|nr:hypothetical protein [Betaproteobacteria bacterium]
MITFLIMLGGIALASFLLVTLAVYVCIKVGLLPGVSFDLGPKFKRSSTFIAYRVGDNEHDSLIIDASKILEASSSQIICKTYALYGDPATDLSEEFLISRDSMVVNVQGGSVIKRTFGHSNNTYRFYNELLAAA